MLGKCDVCGVNDAIGVASTHVPMSVAFCAECARRGADPESVFEFWYGDFGTRFDEMSAPDQFTTYKNGRYMTYREWATEKAPNDL